jgi:hypothetical protein
MLALKYVNEPRIKRNEQQLVRFVFICGHLWLFNVVSNATDNQSAPR